MDKLLFPHYLLNNSFPVIPCVSHNTHTLLTIFSFGLFVHSCFNTILSYIHRYINLAICQGNPPPPHYIHTPCSYSSRIRTTCGPLLSHVNFGIRLLRSMKTIEILVEIALNLGRVDIFIILSLSTNEHSISLSFNIFNKVSLHLRSCSYFVIVLFLL